MKGRDFLVGVILGSIVGAAIGLLMAPMPGDEAREALGESARNIRDRVQEGGRQFVESGRDLLEQGRSRVAEVIHRDGVPAAGGQEHSEG